MNGRIAYQVTDEQISQFQFLKKCKKQQKMSQQHLKSNVDKYLSAKITKLIKKYKRSDKYKNTSLKRASEKIK